VRKHLVVVVRYVSKRKDIELRFTTSSSYVDREQDGKGNAASDQTSNDSHLQKTQEQVTVQRVVVQDITIRNVEKVAEPCEDSIR
jgi:hypothetical protein